MSKRLEAATAALAETAVVDSPMTPEDVARLALDAADKAEMPGVIKCGFCKFAEPFVTRPGDFIVDGVSVCEEHVDSVSGRGFGYDLNTIHLRQQGER